MSNKEIIIQSVADIEAAHVNEAMTSVELREKVIAANPDVDEALIDECLNEQWGM